MWSLGRRAWAPAAIRRPAPAKCCDHDNPAAMTSHHHRSRATRTGAFSLLELLLALVLLLLLLGGMAFSFSAMSDEAAFGEAAARAATLVHLARAHAATTGRRVQLAFQRDAHPAADLSEPQLWKLAVLWEPDPMARPLVFERLSAP